MQKKSYVDKAIEKFDKSVYLPNYENAEQFARKFKRCTIQKYGNTVYSDTTRINE